jgi:hypothetical protein
VNAYFISGLGADRHAFDRIRLPEGVAVHHLDWLEPLPGESLQTYAQRLAEPIDRSRPFVLVGLSFGGIVSIEIHRFLPARKVFLISTVSRRSELPWYFRVSGKMGLHRLGFTNLIKHSPRMLHWFFGTSRGRLREYLQERIDACSMSYLRWSLDQITQWGNEQKPEQAVHIHGSADRLFPIQFLRPDYVVEGGSHFMIVTHGHRVSSILEKELKDLV